MKQLKAFCVKQNIDFTPIEKAWAEIGKEG